MDSSDRGQLRWGTAQTWDGSDRGTVQTWDSSGGEHLRQGTTWGGEGNDSSGGGAAASGRKCCFGSQMLFRVPQAPRVLTGAYSRDFSTTE